MTSALEDALRRYQAGDFHGVIADYGVLAQDNYEQAFTEAYGSLDELNRAIDRYGGILELVRESGQFEHVDDSLGWDNVDRYISHGG